MLDATSHMTHLDMANYSSSSRLHLLQREKCGNFLNFLVVLGRVSFALETAALFRGLKMQNFQMHFFARNLPFCAVPQVFYWIQIR